MPIKRTEPCLGLPYQRAADTDIRSTFARMELDRLASLVPPLRGCDLCMHSTTRNGLLHCGYPDVRMVFGLQPVHVIRTTDAACGPGAAQKDMPEWSAP